MSDAKIQPLATWLCLSIVGGLFFLASCARSTGSGSPLKVKASISPAPIVGQDVMLHIEMISLGPFLPNTTLEVTLPSGVELVSGNVRWQGDISAGGSVPVDLTIRVTTAGEWVIYAYAFSDFGSGGGYGGSKKLYITSSIDTAEVVEDVDYPATPIPDLQIAPDTTLTPKETQSTNPGPF